MPSRGVSSFHQLITSQELASFQTQQKMRNRLLLTTVLSTASATTLSQICSVEHVKTSLPEVQGLQFGNIEANSVFNSSIEAGNNYPAAEGRNFCNVTVAYAHDGKNDAVCHQQPYLRRILGTDKLSLIRSTYGTTFRNPLNTKAAFLQLAEEVSPSTRVHLA